MSISKVQTSLVMLGREKRAFLLDYSFETSLFQVLADSIGVKRLVDNVGVGFGNLNSIFSLVR